MFRLRSTYFVPFASIALAATAQAQNSQELPIDPPGVIHRSQLVGHTNPNRQLHVTVSLPYGSPGAVEAFVDSVSNPASPNYRQFITPQEVGQRFGLADSQVSSVVDYLKSNGFKINLVAKNHLAVMADCTVEQAERAFGTTINDFHAIRSDEHGHQDYYSFSSALQAPDTIAPYIVDVSGLESFTAPRHLQVLTPTQTRTLYSTAPMYGGGSQGQGRTVGISNWDGFRLSNVPLYYTQYSLPTPPGGVGSNITVKTVSGGSGSGTPGAEGDLDIQMVLGMAPLCNLIVYDGGGSDLIGVLTLEVNDNLADVLTESYGWSISASTATSAHNLHLSMSAQGMTYMAASGDSGTSLEPYSYPDWEPEVLSVGGTVATTDGSGNRTSEVGWSGSGGGWSTNTASFNVHPSWQVGNGVPVGNNHRLVPDVALHAAGGGTGAYYFYLNGSLTSGYIGTSFACPVFAGSLAVSEQKLISLGGLPADGAGKRRFGRIQDLFYSQNGRSDVWYDVTSGSNGKLPDNTTASAGTGWDYVTGWGAINFNAFVNSLVPSSPPAAPTNLQASGGNATVALTWNASTGASSYNVKRATVTGGPYSTVGSSTGTSYNDNTAVNGTTYFYVVTAVNGSGESGNSNEATATPQLSIPAAPANLQATGGNATVSLTWNTSSGATSYNVKRGTTSGGPYSTIGSPTGNSFSDNTVTNGTTYFYVVTAVNGAGESGNSNQASATPNGVDTTAPTTPTGVGASSGPASRQVTIHWNASTDPDSTIQYEVWRATKSNSGFSLIGTVSSLSFTDTLNKSGTTRWYYIVAKDPTGNRSGISVKVMGTAL